MPSPRASDRKLPRSTTINFTALDERRQMLVTSLWHVDDVNTWLTKPPRVAPSAHLPSYRPPRPWASIVITVIIVGISIITMAHTAAFITTTISNSQLMHTFRSRFLPLFTARSLGPLCRKIGSHVPAVQLRLIIHVPPTRLLASTLQCNTSATRLQTRYQTRKPPLEVAPTTSATFSRPWLLGFCYLLMVSKSGLLFSHGRPSQH